MIKAMDAAMGGMSHGCPEAAVSAARTPSAAQLERVETAMVRIGGRGGAAVVNIVSPINGKGIRVIPTLLELMGMPLVIFTLVLA